MLHIGWRQIYEGYDMVLVGKIKEALEGENIDYKVEADNPARSRMSRDVLFGGDPMVLNGVGARAVTPIQHLCAQRSGRICHPCDTDHEAGLNLVL